MKFSTAIIWLAIGMLCLTGCSDPVRVVDATGSPVPVYSAEQAAKAAGSTGNTLDAPPKTQEKQDSALIQALVPSDDVFSPSAQTENQSGKAAARSPLPSYLSNIQTDKAIVVFERNDDGLWRALSVTPLASGWMLVAFIVLGSLLLFALFVAGVLMVDKLRGRRYWRG